MDNKDMPAMPQPIASDGVDFIDTREYDPCNGGLTKLEDFTKAAMQGWLARCSNVPHTVGLDPDEIAKVSISMAKAALEQLDKASK